MGLNGSAGQNRLESTSDVVVVIETEHCVRLGQGLGEFSSIPFSHASHGDDGLGRASLLEVSCSQQGVHRVLLGLFDEPTGVDDDRLCLLGIVHQTKPTGLQSSRQFLGIDVVACAPHRDEVDGHEFVGAGHETPFTVDADLRCYVLPGLRSTPESHAGRPGVTDGSHIFVTRRAIWHTSIFVTSRALVRMWYERPGPATRDEPPATRNEPNVTHSHLHSHTSAHHQSHAVPRPSDPDPAGSRPLGPGQIALIVVLVIVGALTALGLVRLWPHGNIHDHVAAGQGATYADGVTVHEATVQKATAISCQDAGLETPAQDPSNKCGSLSVRIDTDAGAGKVVDLTVNHAVWDSGISPGQNVVVYHVPDPSGGDGTYQFRDFDRNHSMIAFALIFLVVVIAVARWRGVRAVVALGFALWLIWTFMIPALVMGRDPLLIGVVTSLAIMFLVLYLTHGVNMRTTTALVGTIFGILVCAGLGMWAATWSHFTGVSGEDDLLLGAIAPQMHMSVLVTCAIVVAGLGVLNDVTITQASAVWELADIWEGKLDRRRLFTSAMRIGRDHIASTIYTTAFAAAGAALPVLVLMHLDNQPLWQVLTSEQFAAEIIRTLVGSIGLVLAVPLTTAVAVASVPRRTGGQRAVPATDVSPFTPQDR